MSTRKTDGELMQAYVYGDVEAFEILYGRYKTSIWNYLRKYSDDEAFLGDVMQETFLKLHRSRERYDSVKSFRPWLFTICHNTLIDGLRKKGRTPEIQNPDLIESLESPESQEKQDRERPIDEQLLSPLKEKDRKILTLRFEKELSYREVASVMGLSESNTRKILGRSLTKLRAFLGGSQ